MSSGQAGTAAHERIWATGSSQLANSGLALGRAQADALFAMLQNLAPKTAAQTRAPGHSVAARCQPLLKSEC